MEVFVLHILKLNIIAAVVILLVRVLAILFKGRVSARWKYFIWLLLAVTLCVPEDNRNSVIFEQQQEEYD